MRGSFGDGSLEGMLLPMATVRSIRLIGEYKGKQRLFESQAPQLLLALREVARVQSIESSSRVEGATAAAGRVAALASQETTPRDRSEQEIAGYRDALSTVHASACDMGITKELMLQLHRDLYQYSSTPGGAWRHAPVDIVEVPSDDAHRVQLTPVAPDLVEPAVDELVDGYHDVVSADRVEPLVAIPAFVLDLLCIHPFTDGTGRISRIINLLLLHQTGYDVGRYISLDRIIEDSKDACREALEASSTGWHTGCHDLLPWLEYSHGVLIAAYAELEKRVGQMSSGRGAKRAMVLECVNHLPSTFRYADIERACPGISRPTIVRVLGELRDRGEIRCTKGGRDARWERTAQ